MFWRKKTTTTASPPSYHPTTPSEPPKPILRKHTEGQGTTSLRFAGSTKHSVPGVSSPNPPVNENATRRGPPAPLVIVTSHDAPHTPTLSSPQYAGFNQTQQATPPYSPGENGGNHHRVPSRRSSRPTSPSATSFGARARARSGEPNVQVYAVSSPPQAQPATPTSMGFSTPPTRSSPAQGVTPPSPYRATSERYGAFDSERSFGERLPPMSTLGQGGLFVQEEAVEEGDDADVPMLNIIPATPQDQGDEFVKADTPSPGQSVKSLEGAVELEEAIREMRKEMEEVKIGKSVEAEMVDVDFRRERAHERVPTIDLEFDFASLESLMDFSVSSGSASDAMDVDEGREAYTEEPEQYDSDSGFSHDTPPSEPLPPSPPFHSYPSLPSFSSQNSLASPDLPSSSSLSSLASFPDVEEALGSMLASLSNSSMASTTLNTPKEQSLEFNHGIGLDMEVDEPTRSASTTAPLALSPRRPPKSKARQAPPPNLDLSQSRYAQHPTSSSHPQSAPAAPVINHRIAFYQTAKAHPDSPSSGIFTTISPSSSSSSTASFTADHTPTPGFMHFPGSASESELSYMHSRRTSRAWRDSLSGSSGEGEAEADDDDELYTASIMSVTPVVVQGRMERCTPTPTSMSARKGKADEAGSGSPVVFGGDFRSKGDGLGLGLALGFEEGEREVVGIAL
ncbi:hypothetical protein IAT38_002254 [Cryptococcus sp. DSM 104549]